jgi:glutamyl-tRNA synthetase
VTRTGPRFRFAPTPSHSLHLGNAVAALIGWASARAALGTFIVRVEDIDQGRARPRYIEGGLDALEWLGLDWDEGPRVGGALGPYLQSERLELYDQRLVELERSQRSYICTCSRADVRSAQRAPHLHEGAEQPYPGTCRPTPGVASAQRLSQDRGGARLHVEHLAAGAIVSWEDRWCGAQREDVRDTCGDALLGRAQSPTYQLAVVTDDIAMGITHVVRGRDLLNSTARQILLYRALGETPPAFGHHPLLVDEQGRKLSKRDASLSIDTWREGARSPGELLALLARGLGLVGASVNRMVAQDWVELMGNAELGWSNGQVASL